MRENNEKNSFMWGGVTHVVQSISDVVWKVTIFIQKEDELTFTIKKTTTDHGWCISQSRERKRKIDEVKSNTQHIYNKKKAKEKEEERWYISSFPNTSNIISICMQGKSVHNSPLARSK